MWNGIIAYYIKYSDNIYSYMITFYLITDYKDENMLILFIANKSKRIILLQ